MQTFDLFFFCLQDIMYILSWKNIITIMKRQFWSTISPISTKQTIISHLKTLNIKSMKCEVKNRDPRSDRQGNEITTSHSFLFFKKLANKEKMEKLNALHADIMHEHFDKWSKLYKYFIFNDKYLIMS